MKDPWEKAYVYGRVDFATRPRVVHIVQGRYWALCDKAYVTISHTPKPYPVCRECTRRAKELGL